MWVDGKRYEGKAVKASAARQAYEDIVRRLKDPGLLEYIGRDLWKVRIYPVPRQGEQKIQITYTSILPIAGGMISYQYHLRTGETIRTMEKDFTMVVRIKSPHALGPIYSPSHDVEIVRQGDRAAVVSFERDACPLEQDFQLYFVPKAERVGLSLLTQRETKGDRGFFLLLLSPSDLDELRPAPRDLVIVLDTSASMDAEKMRQAKSALNRTLGTLGPDDRFALISFATTPIPFRGGFSTATQDNVSAARNWVLGLEAAGSTDIAAALEAALGLRSEQESDRTLQVLFLTDGLPTVGLTDSREILQTLSGRDRAEIRIYTFGVGDDVDSHLLDQLAERTSGCSTYVRPGEDLEAKVRVLSKKIGLPVRTDLKLAVKGGPRIVEMYPPKLPDLFQGDQLQIAGRFEGHGPCTITLKGRSGDKGFSESFQAEFPEVTTEYNFVAPIWARRKVGYLLDQIRLRGESAEVKKELLRLAADYSIATPYTSLLVVPESAVGTMAVARRGAVRRRYRQSPSSTLMGGMGGSGMSGMRPSFPTASGFMPGMGGMGVGIGGMGGGMGGIGGGMGGMGGMRGETDAGFGGGRGVTPRRGSGRALASAPEQQIAGSGESVAPFPSSGKDAIDLAEQVADLKNGARAERSTRVRTIAGRSFRKIGDAWVDQAFKSSMETLRLRVLGQAYFRLLAEHPELSEIFALGNRITWVSPSGTAVVIDKQGQEEVAVAVLSSLFAPAK
jgi:Ca-activated chloride channel family protein